MKSHYTPNQRTAEFSSRRRALFPSDENSVDSGLGCISPLDFESADGASKTQSLIPLNHCVGDYDIIGLVDKDYTINTPENTPNPIHTAIHKIVTPNTISDESPTQKLKTPHDLSNNNKIPKLTRKTGADSAFFDNLQDTVITHDSCKNSKVRTALFPEIDMSLPSRTFYPRTENVKSPQSLVGVREPKHKKPAGRKQSLYLCNRRNRFNSGQINAGVRHKIRKSRKAKKLSKTAILRTALNIIDKSPLNEFLNESFPSLQHVEIPKEPSPEPEPDPTKKFFKSSRHKGVVTGNHNLKFEVTKGKMSLIVKKDSLKRRKPQDSVMAKRPKLEATNFELDKTEPLIQSSEITNIIQALEEKENVVEMMSPTSQMCNMTSGLALNSPKKAKNLSVVLEAMASPQSEQKKLFPIFYPGNNNCLSPKKEQVKNPVKKFRAISKDQMLLAAGQKRWGVTQCAECKVVYHMGDPGDEMMHLNYHNAGHIFRFNGWKNERVVSNSLLDGKIVQIVPGDPKIWWKKVKEVVEVVNRDLGYYDIVFNTENSQIFFYIKNKIIIGVLVSEVKTAAHRLLTTHKDQVDLCSEESYPIKCGVSRIWVSQLHRKKGVATAMMDCLKRNFVMGYILKNEDIAFSSPTEHGKIFGKNYFNTVNFLIYFV